MLRIRKGLSASKIHAGQTYLEYVLIVTVLLGVLIAMGPMIKRVLQGMILVASDQVGSQINADQSPDQRGTMVQSFIRQKSMTSKTEGDYGNYVYNDNILQRMNQVSDLGFSEE